VSIFATPVMWPASALGDHAFLADINPLHHLIDIVRARLLAEPSAAQSWCVALGLNVTGTLIAMATLQHTSKRIVCWL
jgi:lipopolysaccharide transport system permease protein